MAQADKELGNTGGRPGRRRESDLEPKVVVGLRLERSSF